MDQAPAEATVRGLIASAALDSPVDVKRLLSPDFDDDAFDDELLSPLSPYEDSAPLDETPVGGTASSSSQIFKLETEKAALEREASARQAELRRFKEAMLASRMATRNEVEELRAALRSFQSEVPALRERLAASKAQFGELRIGEPRYRHLRSKPDDQVSVVEFVQARVFEMTSEPAGYDELPVGVSRPQRSPAENGAARRKAEAESARLQDEVDRLREALQRSKAEVTALRSTKRGGERGEKHGDEGDGREVTHLYELERREVERSRVAEEVIRASLPETHVTSIWPCSATPHPLPAPPSPVARSTRHSSMALWWVALGTRREGANVAQSVAGCAGASRSVFRTLWQHMAQSPISTR